jgi:hypothetical protein
MTAPAAVCPTGVFEGSRERFGVLLGFMEGQDAAALTHSELEERLTVDGRELLRQLMQDHMDLRAGREERLEVVSDADGVPRRAAERGHERVLASVFGELTVTRIAYRAKGAGNLHPADGMLNLPLGRHSHGLGRHAALESSRGSFGEAIDAIERFTGQKLGKRQIEQLAQAAAQDFDAFYAERERTATGEGEVLVISCDGKGVIMRQDALRAATAKAAATSTPKLKARLSKGEKRNRKRMAEVGAVYEVTPAPRGAADVLPASEANRQELAPGPIAQNKWLTASVLESAAQVVSEIFDEADRRDGEHQRTWLALVDGNNHQIDRIQVEARARGKPVTIIIDFVHVLEYVWGAAWSLYAEGDPAAEAWVRRHAHQILQGRARQVAATIRRAATNAKLDRKSRAGADRCADYLTNKHAYLDYPTALENGWPIATGVIEGACRHLVQDRMDRTGARWGLAGAEAILKLRALCANGDFEDYWRYHLAQERARVHLSRYANNTIPQAA